MKATTQIAVVAVIALAGAAGWYWRDQIPFLGAAPQQATAPGRGGPAGQPVAVEIGKVETRSLSQTVETVGTAQANEAVTITAKTTGVVSRIGFQEGQKVPAGTMLIELDAGENKAKLIELRALRDNIQQQLERARQLFEARATPAARVDDLKKQLEAADARIRAEEAKYGDTVLKAPFGGKVGMRQMSMGSLVRPGDMITTLDDISVIKLEFEVPETYLSFIQPGLKVAATSAAYPGRKYDGTVNIVDTRIDPVTRSAKVRAMVPNPDESLRPGMFLTVQLTVGQKKDAIVVPEESLLAFAGQQFVFVVREGRAYRTRVSIGQRQGGVVEVTEGLQPGLSIVTAGIQKVRDGLPVRPVGADAPTRPPQGQPAAPSARGDAVRGKPTG